MVLAVAVIALLVGAAALYLSLQKRKEQPVVQVGSGMTIGSGVGTVIATVTAGDSVCAVTSAATQLSGGIEYAIY